MTPNAESLPVWATGSGEFWTRLREIVREELVELDRLAPSPLLTLEEAAKYFRCSTRHLRRLRTEGLPCVMLGESPRFERDAVVAWLRARDAQASERCWRA